VAKVLITLEDNLLRRIDRATRERGLTRSAYMAQLAERDLDQEVGPGADPEVRAALASLRELFARNGTVGDSTAIIREERDKRGERYT
jgi:metal-responsive CopG/Arc/MetJ family transcriptional regulator